MSERLTLPGVALGLAWTPLGGEIMFVEASRMEGEGQLTLTGQLGDVMKESAHLAISWLRANAKTYQLTNSKSTFKSTSTKATVKMKIRDNFEFSLELIGICCHVCIFLHVSFTVLTLNIDYPTQGCFQLPSVR